MTGTTGIVVTSGMKNGKLVDVLEHDVVRLVPEVPAREERKNEVRVVPVPPPENRDAVDRLLARAARPTGGQSVDGVPPPGETRENLVEMDLGAARLGIFDVTPVHGDESASLYSLGEARPLRASIPFARSSR